MKNSPKIQRFIYFICKDARSVIPSEFMRNPRALFNFYIYASNKLNDIFKFNMTKNDIIEQVYAYVRYGDLCNSYYVDNEWPVKFEDVEYELNRSNIDYETEANIENINNFEYFSVPDSRDFHREIRDEIVEYEANEVDACIVLLAAFISFHFLDPYVI